MTQRTPSEKHLVQDYLKACGYGDFPPNSKVRPPVQKTGDAVQDYIKAAGYGLPKKPEV
jgi:hypothetical protein